MDLAIGKPDPVRILQLEDSPDDAELALAQLRRVGMTIIARRVQTREAFVEALDSFHPNIVLADFKLPGFDGRTALELAQRAQPDLPVVMVSGFLGDEGAVELLKAGATDFVLKDRLARLPAAIERAIAAASEQRLRLQAESDLRDREDWFRTIFETAPLAVAIASLTGHIQQVNAAFTALLGYTIDDVFARPIDELTHPDDRAITRARNDELRRGAARQVRYAKRYLHKDGTPVYVHVTVSEAWIRGQPFLIGQIFDLTEIRRAECAARTAHERLATTLSGAGAGVWEIDIATRQMTWDATVRKQYGLAANDPTPTFDAWLASVHKDDLPGLLAKEVAVLQCRAISLDHQFRVQMADGSTHWMHSFGRVERDGASGQVRAIGISIDVTEQVRSQVEEQRLAAIIESTSDAIIGTDLEGRVTSWNRASEGMFGYTCSEALGMSVTALTTPQSHGEIPVLIATLLQGESMLDVGMTGVRKDGSKFEIELTLSPVVDSAGAVISLCAIARDVTERNRQQAVLARVNRALKALSRANSAVLHSQDEAELYALMTRAIVEAGGYRMAWVGLVENDEQRSVRVVGKAGEGTDYADKAMVSWAETERGAGPVGRCIRSGKNQLVPDIGADPLMKPWRGAAREAGFRSIVSLPLMDADRVFGVLSIYSPELGSFGPAELDLLSEMAGELSFGIRALRLRADHAASVRRLERSMEATVQALATTVEVRDPYTAGHQRRVADLALAIAGGLGLDRERLHGIELAATIHDIGKLNVPAEILAKPGRISATELELIRTHAAAGAEILKDIEFPWPIREMVWQHHERMDGTGYPRRLKGDEILLEARIIAVADVVEAMASHRPYRQARGIEVALAEIERGRGTAYDPAAVDACLRLFRQQGFTLRE